MGGVVPIVYGVTPNVNRCAAQLSRCSRRAVAVFDWGGATDLWENFEKDVLFFQVVIPPKSLQDVRHSLFQQSPAPSAEPHSAESSSQQAEPAAKTGRRLIS